MFELMNKDTVVATFDIGKVFQLDSVVLFEQKGTLPIGCTQDTVDVWVRGRFASKHRGHIEDFLLDINAADMAGFIRTTHSLSINDSFWIRELGENITWSDVSLYSNDFDEVVQHLAFDGKGLGGVQLTSTSPEFGTNGAYEKCWVREDDGIFLYKRGTEGFSNSGMEPYSEASASYVFNKMKCGIDYELVKFRGKVASKCKLFTDANVGFVPYSVVRKPVDSLPNMLQYMDSIGSLDRFRRMIVSDAVTFNTDRHTGNFGISVNNDSMEVLSMAECFDYNLALFPMELNDAFATVKSFVNKYSPKYGDNFISNARTMLTPSIRADLINLKGFKYPEIESDGKWVKERGEWLSDLSNQQINLILGTTSVSMYTSPNKNCVSNIYKYRMKFGMDEDAFQQDVPRLMKMFGVSHMSELEDKIVELLD